MNFYEIVNADCKRIGITVTELLHRIDMSSGNTGAWKKGGHPGIDKLIEISDILNVSIDHLLGRDETKIESTIIPYGGNERIDSIIKMLLNSNIDDNDLHIIEAVLSKYKK